MTVPEIISHIVDGNTRFTGSHDREYFEGFKLKQEPFMTLVN
jgi:hypothetical protein